MPRNWFSLKSKLTTRPSPLVWTPNHSPSGLSLSQWVLFVQLSPFVASYSATSTARSGFIGSGSPESSWQFSPPRLSSILSSQAWKAASVGAHNCVSSSHRVSKLVKLTNDAGSAPDNWLEERYSSVRFCSCPIAWGIGPLNWLWLKPSLCRFCSSPIAWGIDPLNWLWPRVSACRFCSCPIAWGIDPLNWLPERCRFVRFCSSPIAWGIDPLNWLL